MRLINITIPSLFLGLGFSVKSSEVTVMSGGAIEPGLKAAAAAFEKQTGHKVNITFNTAPKMRERLVAGDAFDVVIAPPAMIAEFTKAGRV